MLWLVSLIVFAILVTIAVSFACWYKAFYVKRELTRDVFRFPKGPQYSPIADKMREMAEHARSIPCEDVYTTSRDGLKLHARLYIADKDAPFQIMMHGYRSNSLRDFSGGMPYALESGCNVLLVDQRAHGLSEGRCLGFGILEKYDCLSWVGYLMEQYGKDRPIVLTGISMGAATVMMASALDLPPCVRGVIADCGYTSPEDIIRKVMRDGGIPQWTFPFLRIGARLFGGFSLKNEGAETALAHSKVPVLFIHGEDDRFVPCDMTMRDYRACTSVKYLLTVKDAGHGLSYIVNEKAYKDAVSAFLGKYAFDQ